MERGDRAWFREALVVRVAVLYALGLAVALVTAEALTVVAVSLSGGRSPVILAPLAAAIVEPIASKLLPALALAAWFARRRPERRRVLARYPLRLGAFGGLVVGTCEVAVKLATTAGLYGAITAVTGGVLLPIALHAAAGGLIGNAVLRFPADRHRRWHDPAVATAAAVLGHLAWNGVLVAGMVARVS